MYVGVVHTITDVPGWTECFKEFDRSAMPAGLVNAATFVGANSDYVFCLWEAPALETLRDFLDPVTAGAATNLYFVVDPDALGTIGFPHRIGFSNTTDTVASHIEQLPLTMHSNFGLDLAEIGASV
jgi:hypothetical protein